MDRTVCQLASLALVLAAVAASGKDTADGESRAVALEQDRRSVDTGRRRADTTTPGSFGKTYRRDEVAQALVRGKD